MTKKGIEYYMSLQYRINLRPLSEDDGGGWLAEAIELPGCMSDGENKIEAIQNLEGAKEAWIATALEKGFNIPEPKIVPDPEYNGRITMRLPKTLHRKASEEAEKEGMSLNTYLVYLISENHSAVMASRALQICQGAMVKKENDYMAMLERLWMREQETQLPTRKARYTTVYNLLGGGCVAANQ